MHVDMEAMVTLEPVRHPINIHLPVRCGALENITDVGISSYPYSIYAIDKNGALWVWGRNNNGQLGFGDTVDRSTPLLNVAMKNIIKAIPASGSDPSGENLAGCGFVLQSNGSVWAVGYNGFGQLGLGDTTSRSSFTQIPLSESVIDISITDGKYGSVDALTNQRQVYLWGANGYGQLGTDNTNSQYSPFKPKGAFQGKVTRVQIGGGISYDGCIIQCGNELWAAGYNEYSNLGLGHAQKTNNSFQKIMGISGKIIDWNVYGSGTFAWGLGVL
nr:hypothetical protein [Bartonella rattaustraliani]